MLARFRVYPHVCGAAGKPCPHSGTFRGLSPRVWGSLQTSVGGYVSARSIPTCVGQPLTPFSPSPPAPVYPHVCGAAAGW